MLLIESAGEPIFTIASLGLFVPAITNITLFSYCILSNIAASKEIKLSLISWLLPSEIFHTFMSGLSTTILFILSIIKNEDGIIEDIKLNIY